ncbi:hypothetical protein CGLO_02624 [Colletotrichum gloeosporioides Cg-14]|uniref:Ubiquitin-like protease family profile domain-containing protein n=1 Tax=Colletotrichum gloeosporioides (strain Cg-14) TaxID=1237896 RepID=T0KXT5_COLGC|nr:hypothetical protein CGLO_02624 [Colletotrichum gloeosporioides Cg-14]
MAVNGDESGSIPPSLEPAHQFKNAHSSSQSPLICEHVPNMFRSNNDVSPPETGRRHEHSTVRLESFASHRGSELAPILSLPSSVNQPSMQFDFTASPSLRPQITGRGLKRNLDDLSPERAQGQQKTLRSRLSLSSILNSMNRLGPETWIDDVIMFVFGCRLVSDNVGFIDSLTISSLTRTKRARLNLQQAMRKDTVLMFYNQNNHHWILFVYTRRDSTLREYNSLPSASPHSCTGNEEVPNFLRWATNDRNLRIRFQKPKCAEQPNGFDCGIYVLVFADCIAKGAKLPTAVDGPSYRKYLQSSLFLSVHAALRLDELVAVGKYIPHTTSERAAQLKDLAKRRRLLMELGKDYEKTSDTSCQTHVQLLWRRDRHQTHQSILAGLIHCIRNTHQAALDAALASKSKVESDAETGVRGGRMDGPRTMCSNATLTIEEHPIEGFLGSLSQETCRQTTRN